MGLLRILLALAVVSAHFTSHRLLKLVGGETAVQAFFIISGFYIAMIFPKHYPNATSFWKSRFFRLYPAYLFCGLFAFSNPMESLQQLLALPPIAALIVFITNSTLLFQDAMLFLEIKNNAIAFTPDFLHSDTALVQHMMVRQAWSLGLEVSFYLLAPFIITRWQYLVVLLFASLGLRLVLIHFGFKDDPWSYRFFPTELALFLLGSLSYKVAHHMSGNVQLPSNKPLAAILLTMLVIFICCFPFIPIVLWQKKIMFYGLLTCAIPVIFSLTHKSALDNFMGNLSYPVYCCHLIVLGWISKIPGWELNLKGTFPGAVLAMLIIIGFAYLLFKYIETPVEHYRQKFKRQNSGDSFCVPSKAQAQGKLVDREVG